MRPLQVWLPWLGYSIGHTNVARDVQRAYAAWNGEDVVFMLPGLRRPERWRQKALKDDDWGSVVAIPSEHRDAATVIHVGENGYVFAPFGPAILHGRAVAELLDSWIGLDQNSCRLIPAVPVSIQFPSVEDGQIVRDERGIRYEVESLRLEPGGGFPLSLVWKAENSAELELRWPPEEWDLRTVHADAESAERGHRTASGERDFPGAVDLDTGEWHPHFMWHWDPPFNELFRAASGLDPFLALQQMRAIVRQGSTDPASALAAARTHSALFLSEGDAPLASACLCPKAIELLELKDSTPISAFWESYGIIARTFEEAVCTPQAMHRIAVTRAWGGIGLLWAVLLARLEEERPLRACRRCGKALTGRKAFCDVSDDAICYAARRAEDKRRSRKPTAQKPRRI